MQFTFKPWIDTVQLANNTFERITRSNLEAANNVFKITAENAKTYFEAWNTFLKLYEDSTSATTKKA